MSVQWLEPPPVGGPQDPRAVYVERLRLVREHPMRWALIRSGTPSAMHQAANALRCRRYHVPPGDWQFSVRSFRRGVHVGDMNVANLYARYRGPDDESWRTKAEVKRELSVDATFNDDGKRVCPACGAELHHAGGRWPVLCPNCNGETI